MGMLVPARTPAPVVETLRAAIAKAISDPAVADNLSEQAVELSSSNTKEFASFIKAEHDKWGKLIKDAKLDLRQ